MKTWPLSWRSQFSRYCLFLLIINLSWGFLSPRQTYAAEIPGLIESLETLMSGHRSQYFNELKIIRTNSKFIRDLKDIKNLTIDSRYLKSLIFYSSLKYIKLADQNQCIFYKILESNLLQTSDNDQQNLLVSVIYQDDKKETALISKNNFFSFIYKKKCFTNKETKVLFNNKNIVDTIKTLTFRVPENKKECIQILENWKKNPNIPYLCRIADSIKKGTKAKLILTNSKVKSFSRKKRFRELIKQGKFYEKNITFFQKNYLKNLCNGIDTQKLFCQEYLAEDAWNKVINGEMAKEKMSYKCKNILGRQSLSVRDLKKCRALFLKDKDYCQNKGAKGFPSLIPYQNCEHISLALNTSRLIPDYHDCPGTINNEGIINIHRFINHFSPRAIESSPETCAGETSFTFAKLNLDYGNKKGWPLKICYPDKIEDATVCKTYVPGNLENNNLSEGLIIANILKRNYGAHSDIKCRIIAKKEYRPKRLGFQVGCFIIYDPLECTTLHCPKEIKLDLKEIKGIKYTGKTDFDYFPTSFSNEKFSMINIMEESFKLKKKIIRNLTALVYFFDNFPKGILQGVGCIEDILPERFQKKSFNQCTPHPFLVSGYTKKNNKIKLIIHLSIEDIHTPRLMEWNYIFSSLSTYQKLHPLGTWALYGFY